jgi:hypothetical protein
MSNTSLYRRGVPPATAAIFCRASKQSPWFLSEQRRFKIGRANQNSPAAAEGL